MIAGAIQKLLVASAAGATLAACSGLAGPQPFAPANVSSAPRSPLGSNAIPHPDRARSWMSPQAHGTLLYLSDASTYDVYVYSWPSLSLVGTLTGFNGPAGECVDGAGNVWIVNVYSSTIVEYAHGGTTPIASLTDAGEYPYSCSVNKKSGDVAVGNIESTTGGAGSVTVYQGASGIGTNYPAKKFFINFVAYDGGKLFVDGGSASGAFALKAFRQGHFRPVTIAGAGLNFAGGVQVAGGSLTVGDQSGPSGSPVIYQMSKSGAVTGSTTLTSGACVQYTIKGSKVVCPNNAGRNFQVYDYPAGGAATQTITGSFSDPFGSAISP